MVAFWAFGRNFSPWTRMLKSKKHYGRDSEVSQEVKNNLFHRIYRNEKNSKRNILYLLKVSALTLD